MGDMTWQEVEAALAAGTDTVIIVAAAQEQHSAHLPLATDSYWGAELARQVAEALDGRALIAPVIPFGPNEEMMGFPGTVSLRHETLMLILRDLVTSYARHGFRYALLISSHEGDYAALGEAETTLADIAGIEVVAFSDIGRLVAVIQQTAHENGIDVLAAGAHAGEFETAIMLAAYPDRVRVEQAARGLLIDLSAEPDFFRQDLRAVTPSGIIGDATVATAANGARYWAALRDLVVGYFRARTADVSEERGETL